MRYAGANASSATVKQCILLIHQGDIFRQFSGFIRHPSGLHLALIFLPLNTHHIQSEPGAILLGCSILLGWMLA
jgi:hypothetical protein